MRSLLGIFVLIPVLLLPVASDALGKCTCRNRDGSRYEQGAVACLNVDGRTYLARCEMALNVPNWKKVQDGCPAADRSRVERLAAAL
ncbi:hypothetical protein [Mycoplana dimorpha]|uniref:Uncharacterized protein n=1 Tax=Mycoplana dimorpha TaxID=28320 RepID=A0A2T5BJ01_MYCDI|nr:hypothetical protein [Mycoplana dimorpha]PTM98967.1 hypothetical protein C7449_101635 [Mycoplana dimorpha]